MAKDDLKRLFVGGMVQLRTKGEMQGDDGLVTWDQAVYIQEGKSGMALHRDAVLALLSLQELPEFMEHVKGSVLENQI